MVTVFGVYRLSLGFRSREQDERARARGGLYGMPRRTQGLIGVVYLLLGAALVATSFGWNPLGGLFGPDTKPAKQQVEPRTP
jgi:hypothetical protein